LWFCTTAYLFSAVSKLVDEKLISNSGMVENTNSGKFNNIDVD
jgi:hypothetical protein